MTQNTYFAYEPNTGHYLRAIFADKCPDHATELEPTGLIEPVFNTATGKWEGDLIADKIAKAEKLAATSVDPYQQRLANISQVFMSKIAQQDVKIAQLTAQLKGGN